MPRKPKPRTKKLGVEYRFEIDAYTPETIPLGRLAAYMHEIALIMGEMAHVHFDHLEEGSTVVVNRVEREASPKVRQRVTDVRRGEGPVDALRAYHAVNKLLRDDDASATLTSGAVILPFPGRDEAKEESVAVRQRGSLDGKLTGIRGRDETVHLILDVEGKQLSGLYTNPGVAKQLKWGDVVRVHGTGRWHRDIDGTWSLIDFKVDSFDPLDDVPLTVALDRLRAIPTEWTDDAYVEIQEMRQGPKGKRNGGH